MKLFTLLAVTLAALLAFAGNADDGKKVKKKGSGTKSEKIALDKLPAAVKTAAEGAVKGIVLTKAEKKTKGDVVYYEVEGKADGKEYEIKIATDGKVLKVEQEDGDDDDDDDDDD